MKTLLFILFSIFLFSPSQSQISVPNTVPAFPGAEGYGTTTIGGRNGKIVKVTSLAGHGSGTLRDALENCTEPRIIVFETGGRIDLEGDNIRIEDPFVTIAGQTATGDGIVISHGTIIVATNDVIIRGLRFRNGEFLRPGDHWYSPGYGGILAVGPEAYNVVVDHCSFAWGVNANGGVLDSAHHVTFSWNIFSEGLHCNANPENCHSKGLVLHKTAGRFHSAHHNIFAHNDERNPNVRALHTEIVNNYVYNWGSKPIHVFLEPDRTTNIIGNHAVPGVDSWGNTGSNPYPKGIMIEHNINPRTGDTGTVANSVYVLDNIGPERLSILSNHPDEEWSAVEDTHSVSPLLNVVYQEAQSDTLHHSLNITVDPTEHIKHILTQPCGAGAIIPQRDTVDRRLLGHIANGGGQIIDCVTADDLVYEGTAQGGGSNFILLAPQASPWDGAYTGRTITIVSGPGAGDTATILGYQASNQKCFVDSPWSTAPTSNSVYHLITDCSRNAGGWPTWNGGVARADSDNDGMPDQWESLNGLNPNDSLDAHQDPDSNGYINIEEYLNGFYNCPVSPPPCQAPANLWASHITTNTARLNWDPVPDPFIYTIRGRSTTSSVWTYITVPPGQSYMQVGGLYNNKVYVWQIKTLCWSGEQSVWSEPDTFSTGCFEPDTVSTGPVFSTGARLQWSKVVGCDGYRIIGQKVGNTSWIAIEVAGANTLFKNVFGLEANTTYQWVVKAICNNALDIVSDPSDLDTFTTQTSTTWPNEDRMSNPFGEDAVVWPDRDSEPVFTVYPNPAEDVVIVKSLAVDAQPFELNLMDLSGKSLLKMPVVGVAQEIDLKAIPGGVYLLEITSQSGSRSYEKLNISK